MKPIKHLFKTYKYVNQKVVDGKLYTSYRYRIARTPKMKTIVVCEGKTKVVKDLKTYWEKLK